MGVMTLSDFRSDIQQAMGNRGLGNPFLDRHINYGYQDVCGMVDFEELEEDAASSTTQGQVHVTMPATAWLIKVVRNTTDDTRLEWVPKTEFWRLSQAGGIPTRWTRHKDQILLNPLPNVSKSLKIVYKKSPAILAAVTDMSVLPTTWDAAIFLFAAHFSLMALGEEQRAGAWFQRGIAYVQSRMTEGEVKESSAGLGLTRPFVGQRLASLQLQQASQAG
jgi:hypothetical protein